MKINKTLLVSGLIGGITGTLLFLGPIAFSTDSYLEPDNYALGEVIGYSVMFLSMLPVFFGTRSYRNKFHSHDFTFIKAFGSAMLITLISSVIFYIGNILLYEIISPNFLQDFSVSYREYVLEAAKTETERKAIAIDYDKQSALINNSYLYALIMTSSVFLFGLIISLISALVLRKNNPMVTIENSSL